MRCVCCGEGELKPLAKKGRTIRHKTVESMSIPDDFKIPTCDKCGSEWLNKEVSDQLYVVLEKQFEKMNSKS